jgi:phosphoserine phosphatase RsbU/P
MTHGLSLFPDPKAPLRTLVVDDDKFSLRIVETRLRARGYQIATASDGEEGLAILTERPFDLVFLDVSMPKKDGLEVLREIRDRHLDVAVIMMTAFGSEAVAVGALREGADDYIPKPIRLNDFESAVDRTVKRLHLLRQNAYLRRRLEEEMVQAAQVQRDLIPAFPPELPGAELAAYFRPARTVSGDFVDWLVHDNTLTFTLGDVMGKGMAAALLMATTLATLRATSRMLCPAEALATAAQTLGPDLARSERFVTLFLGRLDLVHRTLTYTNAGHGLGFVRRKDGTVCVFEPLALPLGLTFFDDAFHERTLQLYPGDILVVYSDGVLDACAEGGLTDLVMAGALAGATGADDAIRRILKLVQPPDDLPDDLTLVALTCHYGPDLSDEA